MLDEDLHVACVVACCLLKFVSLVEMIVHTPKSTKRMQVPFFKKRLVKCVKKTQKLATLVLFAWAPAGCLVSLPLFCGRECACWWDVGCAWGVGSTPPLHGPHFVRFCAGRTPEGAYGKRAACSWL
jgi:hypothetical protein